MKELYQPRNVLVTGGAGFIGCNFVRYILFNDRDVRVVNLDLLTYAGSLDNLDELPDEGRHTFVHGDICDRTLVDKLLRLHQIDTIVHFAAESHVDRSIQDPTAFIQTNIAGTYILLEAAKAYWIDECGKGADQCRFHHISTDEVFGSLSPNAPPFTEKSPYAPNSPYAASKASADHLVRSYFKTYGLPMTLSNCSNNYGPYQCYEKFIPTVIQACLEWKSIPVYGDGSNIRDWLFVEDHCRCVDAIVRCGQVGETYTIGGHHELTNHALALQICEVFDELRPWSATYSTLIDFVEDRPGHDWRYAVSTDKLEDLLGSRLLTPFDVAFRKTIAWYIEHAEARSTVQV